MNAYLGFNDKRYVVPEGAWHARLFVLPDNTTLRVLKVFESLPPQFEVEEATNLLKFGSAQETAQAHNAPLLQLAN
jgi:hypothetical protein